MQLTIARRRAGVDDAGAGVCGASEARPNGAQPKRSIYAAISADSGASASGGACRANSGGATRR